MQKVGNAFVKAATAAGLTKEDSAKALATELGLVPKEVAILVKRTRRGRLPRLPSTVRRRPDLHDLGHAQVPQL